MEGMYIRFWTFNQVELMTQRGLIMYGPPGKF